MARTAPFVQVASSFANLRQRAFRCRAAAARQARDRRPYRAPEVGLPRPSVQALRGEHASRVVLSGFLVSISNAQRPRFSSVITPLISSPDCGRPLFAHLHAASPLRKPPPGGSNLAEGSLQRLGIPAHRAAARAEDARPRPTGRIDRPLDQLLETACRPARRQLEASARGGHRPDPVQRLLALRPDAGHDRDGRRGAGALRVGRLVQRRRPRDLLRDGARPPGRRGRRDRDGDDEVVRQQLPLHRPRAAQGHEVPLLLAQAARAVPGGEGTSASRPSRS